MSSSNLIIKRKSKMNKDENATVCTNTEANTNIRIQRRPKSVTVTVVQQQQSADISPKKKLTQVNKSNIFVCQYCPYKSYAKWNTNRHEEKCSNKPLIISISLIKDMCFEQIAEIKQIFDEKGYEWNDLIGKVFEKKTIDIAKNMWNLDSNTDKKKIKLNIDLSDLAN